VVVNEKEKWKGMGFTAAWKEKETREGNDTII